MARQTREGRRISDSLLDELLAGQDAAEVFRDGTLFDDLKKAVAERARGLAVPPMPESAQRWTLELVPFAAGRNPIYVAGPFLNDPSLLDQAIELAATNGDYGSLASFQGSIGRDPALMEATLASWIERKRTNPDKHFAVSGFCTPDYTPDLKAVGIPSTKKRRTRRARSRPSRAFAQSFRERPAVPAPVSLASSATPCSGRSPCSGSASSSSRPRGT